jgi:hypothetical protein
MTNLKGIISQNSIGEIEDNYYKHLIRINIVSKFEDYVKILFYQGVEFRFRIRITRH